MSSTVTIDQTTKTSTETPAKKAAVNALATVGFVALLLIGITLAIYSARYVPLAVSTLGGSGSNTPGSLAVVSATSSTPYNDSGAVMTATTTVAIAPTTSYTAPAAKTQPYTTAPATTGTAYPTPAPKAQPRAPYGLSDLSVTIIATGYLAGESTASFVPANIIPPGARPAVKFSVADNGTNSTGPWNFLAEIPTIDGNIFTSPIEPSLNPGDHTVFTLGFNEAIPGQAQTMTIVADPNNNIPESNEANNSASAAVTITATGN